MKKRNWLMTIAFAVLSLTIISTCVIGSTYAKFVSKVSATGGAKAAGFSVTSTGSSGTVTLTADDDVVAPGETKDVEIAFTYYSQVETEFKAADDANTVVGVGKLADFTAVKDGFAAWLTAKQANGEFEGVLSTSAPASLSDMFTVTFEQASIAEACAAAVGAKDASLTVTGAKVSAMAKDATAALTCSLTATVTWVSINDAWDTYIGELVAEGNTADTTVWSGVTVSLAVTAEQVTA